MKTILMLRSENQIQYCTSTQVLVLLERSYNRPLADICKLVFKNVIEQY